MAVRNFLRNLLIGLLDNGLLDLGDDFLLDQCFKFLSDPIALQIMSVIRAVIRELLLIMPPLPRLQSVREKPPRYRSLVAYLLGGNFDGDVNKAGFD